MNYFFKTLGLLCAAACMFSCEEELQRHAPGDPEELKEYNQRKITIEQGVSGTLLFAGDSSKIYPVSRTIRIYELTTKAETEGGGPFYSKVHTPLLAATESDEDGFYQAALEPGAYSIFIEEDGRLYANGLNGDDEIQVALIDSGWVTMLHPEITYSGDHL